MAKFSVHQNGDDFFLLFTQLWCEKFLKSNKGNEIFISSQKERNRANKGE
jgi:hypothetical protein